MHVYESDSRTCRPDVIKWVRAFQAEAVTEKTELIVIFGLSVQSLINPCRDNVKSTICVSRHFFS